MVHGDTLGLVEVGYLEEAPECDEGPFLKEERSLINAIAERVGSIVERIGIEEALRDSEKRYRTLYDSVADAVFVHEVIRDGSLGRFLEVNEVACSQLGYSREELLCMSPLDIDSPESPLETGPIIERLAAGKRVTFEQIHVTKDGRRLPVEIHAKPFDLDGNPVVISLVRDISERREFEEMLANNLATMENLVENAAAGFCVCHSVPEEPYLRFTHWNARMTELTGFSMAEINKHGWYQSVYLEPEYRQKAIDRMHRMRVGNDLQAERWEITTKDGERKVLSISTSVVGDQGGQTQVLAIMQDVTKHKRDEEALRQREELFRAIFDNAPVMIDAFSSDGNLVLWNHEMEARLGWTAEEAQSCDVLALSYPDPEEYRKVLETINNPDGQFREFSPTAKDGSRPIQLWANFKVSDGSTISVGYDITERKKTEVALKESEAQKQAILDGISANLAFVNENLEILWVNKTAAQSVGKSPSELVGHTCHELWADPERPCDGCPSVKAFKTQRSEHGEMMTPDGRVWDEKGEPVFGPDGSLLGVIEIAHDITDHRKVEEDLKESEERFRLAMDAAEEGLWDWNLRTGEVYYSPGWSRVLGYSESEIAGQYDSWESRIHPEDRITTLQNLDKQLNSSKDYFESVHRLRTKDGDWKWVLGRGRTVQKDSEGNSLRIVGTMIDITNAKLTEEAIQRSEREFRAAFEQAAVGMCHSDIEGRFLRVNQKLSNIVGYSCDELTGMKFHEITHPDDLECDVKQMSMLLNDEISTYSIEKRYCRRDSSIVWVNLTVSLVRSNSGSPEYFVGVIEDITDRKTTEEYLAKSQAELSAIFDSISDPIVFADTNRRIVRVNPAFVSAWGYSPEEVIGRTTEFLYPDKESYEEQGQKRFHTQGETARPIFEAEFRRKDGTLFPTETLGLQVRDSKGEVIGLMGVHRDISDRKEVEERLKKSEAFLNATGHMAKVGGWELDVETEELRWTEQTHRIHELPLDHRPTLYEALNFFHPGDRPKLAEAINRAIDHAEPYDMEIRFRTALGKHLWTRTIGRPVVKNGRTARLVGTFQDITDRKEVEESLRQQLSFQEALIEAIPLPIFIKNTDHRYVGLNKAFAEFIGLPNDKVLGKTVFEVAPQKLAGLYREQDEKIFDNPGSQIYEAQVSTYDGSIRDVIFHKATYNDCSEKVTGVIGAILDITERKMAEEQIKASLAEKEVLLREIHHRVKNNLAVINSLLSAQSQYARDDFHRQMFKNSQDRVRSMSLAHEVLYQSESLADVRGSDYIGNLVDHLVVSLSGLGKIIDVKKEMEDVSFGLKTAIPLGFLVTELFSNCLKHAFLDRNEGEIKVFLKSVNKNEFELVIKDNGIGMPEDVDLKNPTSLGLDLVDTFVEQLKGEIEVRRDAGTEVRIRFKEKA
ncbi:PAS domain S-box protein [Thermodesulfobacteriota bacterium]